MEALSEIDPETTCTKDESSRQENLEVKSEQPDITQIIINQIKEGSDKVKEKAEREDCSDNLKEDTALNFTEEVLKAEQQLSPLSSTW